MYLVTATVNGRPVDCGISAFDYGDLVKAFGEKSRYIRVGAFDYRIIHPLNPDLLIYAKWYDC